MPGLLTLKTKLKSLKYGNDQLNEGNSGQPYIQNDINDPTDILGKDDGFIRGGATGALNASLIDKKRIELFFKDEPQGTLFKYRQVGLQLSNPRLEVKKGLGALASGLVLGDTGTLTGGVLEPTRIYNLGINTLAQVPANAIGGHIVRHGILPVQLDESKYEAVVKYNNKHDHNRLVKLKNDFNLGDKKFSEISTLSKIRGAISSIAQSVGINIPTLNSKQLVINDYLGGPGSVYGIGGTIINRSSFTEDKEAYGTAVNGYRYAGKTRNDKDEPVPVQFDLKRLLKASNYASSSLGRFLFNADQSTISSKDKNVPANLNGYKVSVLDPYSHTRDSDLPALENINDISNNIYGSPSFYYKTAINGITGSEVDGLTPLDLTNIVYTGSNAHRATMGEIIDVVENLATNDVANPNIGIYTQLLNGELNNPSGSDGRLPISQYEPHYTNYYGESITIKAARGTGWSTLTREKRVGSGRRDSLNLTPLFDANAGTLGDASPINIPNAGSDVQTINDLVKFRIQAIDSNSKFSGGSTGTAKWMIFRAYITDLSDNVDATWSGTKYAGRGDQFYIYEGFTRKMSVTFKVAALSRYEMEPMYQKLNFLMSNLMPDYSTEYNGVRSSQGLLMKGPLMRMTIGNWIDGQLCKLDNLSYRPVAESPWEIGLNDEELILPHIIEVTLNFTPIGSQTRHSNELPRKADCVSNIAQNWNGKTEREYIKPCDDPTPPVIIPTPVPDPAPKPTPNPKPVKKKTEIPPAYDQSTGTALSGLNNPGKEPKFATPAQEKAYLKARGLL